MDIATLSEFLAPLTTEQFLSHYWQSRALYVPGEPRRWDGLIDVGAVPSALIDNHELRHKIRLRGGFQDEAGKHHELDVHPEQVNTLVAAGVTVMMPRLELLSAELRKMTRILRSELLIAEPMDVACFISRVESGYGMHYDPTTMWILQLEGQKEWTYGAEPVASFPPITEIATPAGRPARPVEVDRLERTVLSPGDLLYLPPGTWHRARALSRSTHLSIAVMHQHALVLVHRYLRQKLTGPHWRHFPFRSAAAGPGGDRRAVLADMEASLCELRKATMDLTAEELYEIWKESVDSSFEPAPREPATAPPSSESPSAIAPDDWLEHSGAELSWAIDPSRDVGERLVLYAGGTAALTMDRDAEALLRHVVSCKRFQARDLPQDGQDGSTLAELLQALVDVNALRRVPAPSESASDLATV